MEDSLAVCIAFCLFPPALACLLVIAVWCMDRMAGRTSSIIETEEDVVREYGCSTYDSWEQEDKEHELEPFVLPTLDSPLEGDSESRVEFDAEGGFKIEKERKYEVGNRKRVAGLEEKVEEGPLL